MYRLACLLLATLLTTTDASSHAPDSEVNPTPVGVWTDANERIRVEITQWGDRFYGEIVWLSWLSDPQGLPLVDVKNSDPMLRARPLLGLVVLRGFGRADPRSWEGTIYNPRDGKEYSAVMSIEDDGSLQVRAFVLLPLFGQTHFWRRVNSRFPRG